MSCVPLCCCCASSACQLALLAKCYAFIAEGCQSYVYSVLNLPCQQGVSSLAVAPSIGQLQQLDLSHNALGPAAASGLAQLLENATQLQTLNLKSTKLEDEGEC